MASPEYFAFRTNYEALVTTVSQDLDNLCNALFARAYISPQVRDYCRLETVESARRGQRIVDAINDQIEHDPSIFHGFLKVLLNPHTETFCKSLEECYRSQAHNYKVIHQDDSTQVKDAPTGGFLCPYCGKCSLEQYLSSSGCPEAAGKTEFPYLNVSELSARDKRILEVNLKKNIDTMIRHFADTDTTLQETLNADVRVLKNFILNFVSPQGQDKHIDNLEKADSVSDVFVALHPFKSFLNYGLVDRIVDRFGSDENRRVMKEYTDAFDTYCKRNAFEVPISIFPKLADTGNETVVSFKLTAKGEASLKDAISSQEKIASALGVNEWDLVLCSIERGCMCLRFKLYAATARKVFPLSDSRISTLQNFNITIQSLNGKLDFFVDACGRGKISEVVRFVQQGADKDYSGKHGTTPLMASIKNGYTDVATFLVVKGADVNKCDENGDCPIHVASRQGYTQLVNVLTSKGAYIDQRDKWGRTPLLVACARGHTETVLSLVHKEADVNLWEKDRYTPLSITCKMDDTELAALLIDNGARINHCDRMGRSPLLIVCERGFTNTAKVLVEKGADIHQTDYLGISPINAALESNNTALVDLLMPKISAPPSYPVLPDVRKLQLMSGEFHTGAQSLGSLPEKAMAPRLQYPPRAISVGTAQATRPRKQYPRNHCATQPPSSTKHQLENMNLQLNVPQCYMQMPPWDTLKVSPASSGYESGSTESGLNDPYHEEPYYDLRMQAYDNRTHQK